MENKDNTDKPTKPVNNKPILKPTIQMDSSENPLPAEEQRDIIQPLDYAKVTGARKTLPPRPQLSQSTHNEVKSSLKDHNQATKQKIQEKQIKMKKTQNITQHEKEKRIIEMMAKQSCTVGVAPISKDHVHRVCEQLTKNGDLKKTEDYDTRINRTVKSIVKAWTKKNLGMNETEWDGIDVTKIALTNTENSDIAFITFKTFEDAAKVTSKAHNLPKNNLPNDPRLIMYVDQRAKKRFDAVQNIAKTIRIKSANTIQTTVRNGRRDFLLRQKNRGDLTPWSQIPPIKLEEDIPDFEIGIFKNIYSENSSETDENDHGEEEDDEDVEEEENEKMSTNEREEQQEISNEIARQYSKDEELIKRQHSEESLPGVPAAKAIKKLTFQPTGTNEEVENEQHCSHEMSKSVKKTSSTQH